MWLIANVLCDLPSLLISHFKIFLWSCDVKKGEKAATQFEHNTSTGSSLILLDTCPLSPPPPRPWAFGQKSDRNRTRTQSPPLPPPTLQTHPQTQIHPTCLSFCTQLECLTISSHLLYISSSTHKSSILQCAICKCKISPHSFSPAGPASRCRTEWMQRGIKSKKTAFAFMFPVMNNLTINIENS